MSALHSALYTAKTHQQSTRRDWIKSRAKMMLVQWEVFGAISAEDIEKFAAYFDGEVASERRFAACVSQVNRHRYYLKLWDAVVASLEEQIQCESH